jgi:phospholipid/cholesterol/gamma-HCH transport system ATP-binding protein
VDSGDGRVLLRDLNFNVHQGDVFVVMGPSGCGKSVLMRTLVGLQEPIAGDIFYDGQNFTTADPEERGQFLSKLGVLFQSPALFTSMTLLETVALPLSEFTNLSPPQIRELASLKLALVGLRGFEAYYPMDPITSRLLDTSSWNFVTVSAQPSWW